jgi:hypothetical protein
MIVSVVHELGHCLTGYLSGDPDIDTPKLVGIKGRRREAGYALEKLVFEHILEMWGELSRGPNQPGVPYAFKDARNSTKGRRVSMKYLREFIDGTSGML